MSVDRLPAAVDGSQSGAPVAEVVDLYSAGSGPLCPVAAPPPPDLHPVRVDLASLSEGSRRTMRAVLETVADPVSTGGADTLTLPW